MKNGSYFMPREQLLSFMNPGARQPADEFKRDYIDTVSYTHLTLPTIYSV